MTSDVEKVVEGSNEFALALFSEVAHKVPGDLFMSPSSISLAMAMTFAGASGQTAVEMARTLRFSLPDERLHDAFHELQQATRTGGIELHVANRLWGQRGYGYHPQFMETCRDKYGAELAEVDFKQSSRLAARRINLWVKEQTAGKICDLVPLDSLDAMSRLVLTNAIYFLGCWEHEFNEAITKESLFTSSSNGECAVPMMRQTGEFRYGEWNNCQVLELPYREKLLVQNTDDSGSFAADVVESPACGSDLAMVILLPRKLTSLTAIDDYLTPQTLKAQLSLTYSLVDVWLPRFRIEASLSLVAYLKVLGIEAAFSRDADFSKISDDPEGLLLSDVIHKAFVDVNEKGTEAAAATAAIAMGAGISQMPEPIIFHADHPFLFLIRDMKTGLIHFIGRMAGEDTTKL